ncbi:MAG: hypothetical protein J6Z02_03760, partial [Lachnospiraceae bacterium]|nr:hypothetical protein [Lachnospiraceae bacterium]
MKSRKTLKRLAIVLFIALCGFFYTFKAGESPEPVIEDVTELPESSKTSFARSEKAQTAPQTEAALPESGA